MTGLHPNTPSGNLPGHNRQPRKRANKFLHLPRYWERKDRGVCSQTTLLVYPNRLLTPPPSKPSQTHRYRPRMGIKPNILVGPHSKYQFSKAAHVFTTSLSAGGLTVSGVVNPIRTEEVKLNMTNLGNRKQVLKMPISHTTKIHLEITRSSMIFLSRRWVSHLPKFILL